MTRHRRRTLLSSAAAFITTTLAGVAPTPLVQLDANLVASYPGSGQTFANVIAAPADASAQTAYDFFLGATVTATTDDPTFVQGTFPTASKFTMDGGDIFTIKTMTTALNNFHRSDTGQLWWCVCAFKVPDVTTTQSLAGTSNGATVAGWRVEITAGNIRIVRANGTTNGTNIILHTGVQTNTAYLLVFTFDPTTGAYTSALNSRTFGTTGTTAFTNTVAVGGKNSFGGANTGAARLVNGSETYGHALGLGAISNAQLSAIVDYYNALHGRTYA